MSSVNAAVVGNGMFGALVDHRGRYIWCCMDTFDGDPVFNCLLNNNSDMTGFFDVTLEGFERAEQSYLSASTVLITTLHSSEGDSVEIRDFAPRFTHFDRIFRPFQLFRTVRRLKGEPRIKVRIRPTFNYNSRDGYQTRGSSHVRFCGPKQTWRATTNTSVRYLIEEMSFLVPMAEPVYIVFGADESFSNSLQNTATDFEGKTISYWKQWCNTLCLPVEFQDLLIRAAVTVAMMQSEDSGGFLAALTPGLPLGPFGPTEKTRDTRVCRLLDECLALPVLRDIGLLDVCRRFLVFAKDVCFQEGKPQHTYTAFGGVRERPREWAQYLAGYRGMMKVHHGGPLLEPPRQKPPALPWEAGGGLGLGGLTGLGLGPGGQADVPDSPDLDEWNEKVVIYGLLVISLAHAFFDIRLSHELCSHKLFEKLELYAGQSWAGFQKMQQLHLASGTWSKPAWPRPPSGAGFFDDDMHYLAWVEEPQGPDASKGDANVPDASSGAPAVHTLSSVLCWAAADRLHRIASHYLHDSDRAEYWRGLAHEMRESIMRHAWNPLRTTFTTYWGGESVGPSLLRLAELGFLAPEDGRFRGTVRAFEADAAKYAVSFGGPDSEPVAGSVASDEGISTAPSVCFMTNTLLWYCEALRSTGSVALSRRLLEALVACAVHPGILSESVDLRTAELWGNTPSLPALLSLLRVAPRLSRSWREV